MKEYVKLIRGLIGDFSLMLLNNDIVLGTINIVLRGFDVNNLNTFTNFLTSVLVDRHGTVSSAIIKLIN